MGEALRQQVRLPVRDRREVEEELQLALDDRSLEGRALGNSWALAVHIERRRSASTTLTTGSFQLRNRSSKKSFAEALPRSRPARTCTRCACRASPRRRARPEPGREAAWCVARRKTPRKMRQGPAEKSSGAGVSGLKPIRHHAERKPRPPQGRKDIFQRWSTSASTFQPRR